jgi:hypothetical protein
MITLWKRLKYNYFFVYIATMYFFFIHLNFKRDIPTVDINITSNSSLSSLSNYSLKDISSKENKIVLDLKYKNGVHRYSLDIKSFAYIIDLEGKVLGSRTAYDQKVFSNVTNDTINVNKKLLHSTVFGSIKLIKV